MAGLVMRLIMALVVAVSSLISYCGSKQYNPVTGEEQYISLTARQEVSLGMSAVDEMMARHGGLLPADRDQERVDAVGQRLVRRSAAGESPWPFEFHLLADSRTVNAFALPGGQIFITAGLYQKLSGDAPLAAILAHEIAHVVARHSSEHIAKARLTRRLTDAVVVASGDATVGQISAVVGALVNMKFSRDDEVEADRLGVFFMADAGYRPEGMIEVMEILAGLGAGGRMPEFFSTHPSPDNRIGKIAAAIRDWEAQKAGGKAD